jgi:hypothetical protein
MVKKLSLLVNRCLMKSNNDLVIINRSQEVVEHLLKVKETIKILNEETNSFLKRRQPSYGVPTYKRKTTNPSPIRKEDFQLISQAIKSDQCFVLCMDKIAHTFLIYGGVRVSNLKHFNLAQVRNLFRYQDVIILPTKTKSVKT